MPCEVKMRGLRGSGCPIDYERLLAEAGVVTGRGERMPPVSLEGAHRHMPCLPVFAIALSAHNA